jgi:hypothetical protein
MAPIATLAKHLRELKNKEFIQKMAGFQGTVEKLNPLD